MLKHENTISEKEVTATAHCIDEEQDGIYAYPHESEEEKQETIRLMKNYIKNRKQ
ncbi:hypothetical protein [Aquibacillus albus]|uniref:Uncharacterized protein n=1 Tax=Aquibacillus albus TaxID=1168171 RepID=A0ABS2N2J7_9BACI|nr:hypothetical protein [Aquibacillus albus]MBM7572362.1 hypothetical protein [Aquibacillus albus]